MTESEIKKIILDKVFKEDGSLYDLGWYIDWELDYEHAILDGSFSADELISIGHWMKLKGSKYDHQTKSP